MENGAHLRDADLTGSVIGGFYEVYNALRFGFLEAIYSAALELELRERGHVVDRQVGVTIRYKGFGVGNHRLDMLVDGRVIVEVKSTVQLHLGAGRQVYNYLKATGLRVGLLLHFGPEARFYRFTNDPAPEARRNEDPA